MPTSIDRRQLGRALSYVDSWLGWWVPRSGIVGATVAVSVGDEVLLSGGYGMADIQRGVAMAPDGVFRVASHSKTFTATAVMTLVERGHLRLDDAVATHVPWLAGHTDPRWRSVTVRQLLCHGGGVTRDGGNCDFWQLQRPFPTAGQLRDGVLAEALVTEANAAMKYTNIGYGVLGALVEEVAGVPYGDYVAEHLTGPLGLTSTVAEPTGALADRVVAAHGTRCPDGSRRVIPPVPTGALAAATGFASTAPEMCRWMAAHLIGSGRLLGDDCKREMQRVHWHVERMPAGGVADYGLGLILEKIGDRRTIGHSGGFPGHITKTVADPADGLVVSVLTNSIDGPARLILAGVFGVVDAFVGGVTDPDDALADVDGRYQQLWGAVDLVASGSDVLIADPAGWAPFGEPDRLELVDASTLRVAETSSFGSPGELVHLSRDDDGRVIQVQLAGTTHWAEADWPDVERGVLGD